MKSAAAIVPDVPFSLEDVDRQLARVDLMEFVLRTMPGYQAGWFHRLLAEKLDQFLLDSVEGRSPRLIIEAPPRHGKTEETSIRFPAYALGRFPDLTFIAASHTADLAQFINREIQRVIDDPTYEELFPGTRLWENIRTVADGSYLRNSDIFEIVNHKGIYKCAGIGGPITGKGGHILLVDDPVKDAEEAASQTVRDKVWEWFKSTLYTRQAPGAGILLIMTRWHEDDLAGRLLERARKGGEQWDEVRFPAVAEADEFHPTTGALLRREGEALHPERYPRKLLDIIKLGTEDEAGVGSRVWNSLYQQRPSAAEGVLFLRDNWQFLNPPRRVSDMTPEERKLYFKELGIFEVVQRWDTALGGKKQNDMSACVTLGRTRSRYYVIDVWADRIQFPQATRQVDLLRDRWAATRVIVEGGGSASGKATVQTMKRETDVPVFEAVTSTDKVFRAQLVSPIHESGLVWLFAGEPWHSKFIDQCAGFPNIKFDDDVDAFIGALEYASSNRKPMQIAKSLLEAVGVR